MHPCIFSIETTTARYTFKQDEVVETMVEMLQLQEAAAASLRKLYRNSAIYMRHSVLPDFQLRDKERSFFAKSVPSTEARNAIYKKEAPKLAQDAAHQALESWGGDPKEITHVIAVSCTGVLVPGLEFALINALNLRRDAVRLGVNFMGCFGAFQGLSVASAFAKENPKHRILVVCTELCSLHFQQDLMPDTLIANSLFSDGAAAAVVGCGAKGKEEPLWQVVKRASYGLENAQQEMRWEMGDTGFFMRLSREVPALIKKHISTFCQHLLGSLDMPSTWAIHPGGKKIVQAVEESLHLPKESTRATWKVLADHGNMSSATILFILSELKCKGSCACLGFGPGLSVEGMVIQ